jgi:hypothetical protein
MGPRYGYAGWRVEWVKPIDEVARDFRRQGVFLLVDARSKRIMFYGYKPDTAQMNRMIDSLKGRSNEMVTFLISTLRTEGETT